MRLMRRLPMAHKFLLVCLCFAVPLAYLLASLAGDRHEAQAFSAKELVGLQQVRQASALLNSAMALRGNAVGLAAKINGAEARRAESLAKFDAQAQALEKLVQDAQDPLNVGRNLAEARSKAQALASLGSSTELETVITAGYALTDSVLTLIEQASSESNLALDPDADTYYLMLTVTDGMPRLQDAIGRVRALGAAVAEAGTPTYPMLQRLQQSNSVMGEYLNRVTSALNRVAAANPDGRGRHGPEVCRAGPARLQQQGGRHLPDGPWRWHRRRRVVCARFHPDRRGRQAARAGRGPTG